MKRIISLEQKQKADAQKMLNIVNESEQLLSVITDINTQKQKLEEELALQKENTQKILVDLDQ